MLLLGSYCWGTVARAVAVGEASVCCQGTVAKDMLDCSHAAAAINVCSQKFYCILCIYI